MSFVPVEQAMDAAVARGVFPGVVVLVNVRGRVVFLRAAGRRTLESGLGGRDPTDIRIAFLIAREMGHVIARHAEENSGASIAVSALGLLVPGMNVVARFVASRVGASAVKGSWAIEQEREADDIALELLSHTGLSVLAVSLALGSGGEQAGIPDDEWGARYRESMQRIAQIAAAEQSCDWQGLLRPGSSRGGGSGPILCRETIGRSRR